MDKLQTCQDVPFTCLSYNDTDDNDNDNKMDSQGKGTTADFKLRYHKGECLNLAFFSMVDARGGCSFR